MNWTSFAYGAGSLFVAMFVLGTAALLLTAKKGPAPLQHVQSMLEHSALLRTLALSAENLTDAIYAHRDALSAAAVAAVPAAAPLVAAVDAAAPAAEALVDGLMQQSQA